MHLVVLGSTGRLGRVVVDHALAAGYRVTAVARHPDTVTTSHPELGVRHADVLEPDSLKVLADADVVMFLVGQPGRRPSTVRSTGVANVIRAMTVNGVSRILAVSPSAVVIGAGRSLVQKLALRFFVHKLYRNPFLDVERMERDLRLSDLDWTVVRSPALRDVPPTHSYRVSFDGVAGRERPMGYADLADYLVSSVTDVMIYRRVVTIAGTA
ncbi:MAG TPA: NAD(P)H-binding protein [Pseudonocardiaceae bacterium]|nr:NAD(P)H-binding protein [Pseudonocardiaceae bacterium]